MKKVILFAALLQSPLALAGGFPNLFIEEPIEFTFSYFKFTDEITPVPEPSIMMPISYAGIISPVPEQPQMQYEFNQKEI